ncbi:hypothetical protein L484_019997 [Morus notabilis]|uniref:Uncharacterized protein n=1 Tax=Morus notabilis TaxID=981085 RepID=W9SJG2_9ROSA|nr:hypothetical protein L484_019997 [Morus notabilis]
MDGSKEFLWLLISQATDSKVRFRIASGVNKGLDYSTFPTTFLLRFLKSLVELTFLAFFNVSRNHLAGRIPQGNQLNTFDITSYMVNSELCGDPMSKKCGDPDQSSTEPSLSLGDEERDWDYSLFRDFNWLTVVIRLGSGIVVGVMVQNTTMTKKQVLWLAKKI